MASIYEWSTPFTISDSSLCWKETSTLETRFVASPYFSIRLNASLNSSNSPAKQPSKKSNPMNQLRNSPPDPVCTPPDHGGTLHLNGCRNLDQRWMPHAFHVLCAFVVVFLLVCGQRSVSLLWSLEIPAIGMCFGVEKGKKGPECNCEARYEVCWWGRRRCMLFSFDECDWKLLCP